VIDTNYKTADDIIRLLINTSGKGANLLMNIGPQPNGELPAVALDRLKSLGEWTSVYGETIYGTDAGDIKPQKWGVSTQKDGKLYLHITALNEIEMNENGERILHLPLERKVKSVTEFVGGAKVNFKKTKECVTITLPGKVDVVDYVLVLQ
jgi:alpha-L-fucosidase